MSTLTLYRINEEQMRINAMLEESYGEITPEIEEALIINKDNFLVKAENYAATVFLYKSLEERAAEEIKRLQGVKNAAKKIQDTLKSRLSDAMQLFDKSKVEVGTFTLSFRKSTSVLIEDEASIPSRYVVVSTSPDKTKIKTDLSEGVDVPGASLVENRNLQIK